MAVLLPFRLKVEIPFTCYGWFTKWGSKLQTRKRRTKVKWNSGEFLKKMLAEFAAIVGLSEDREKEALNRDVSLDRDGGKPMTPRQVLVRATCTCDAGEKFSFQFPTDCWYLHPGGTQSEKY